MERGLPGHPLIEAVLATNYEWGGLKSRYLDAVLKSKHGKQEELVIMPYPNYGNQCMSVNAINEGEADKINCQYTVRAVGQRESGGEEARMKRRLARERLAA